MAAPIFVDLLDVFCRPHALKNIESHGFRRRHRDARSRARDGAPADHDQRRPYGSLYLGLEPGMNWHRFQWRSHKTRVTVFTLSVFVISFWSLAFYASQMLREDMQQMLSDQQLSAVSFIASDLNHEVEDRLNALKTVAAKISPAHMGRAAALQAELADCDVIQGMFSGGSFVMGLDGTALASLPLSTGRVGFNFKEYDYFVGALKGTATIGQPIMGKVRHTPLVVMAVPIRNALGQVTGVLAGVTDLDKPSFLDKIGQGRYGVSGGYLLVAASSRLILNASDKSRIMNALPGAGVNVLVDRHVRGDEGSGITINPRGVEVLASARNVPAAGWYVVGLLPTAEAFAPIRTMQQRLLLAALFLTVLAGGLTWWMLRRQLAPMLAAVQVLATMSDRPRPSQRLPVSQQDEIGELIGGFNRLLDALEQRDATVRDSHATLRSILETALDGFWRMDRQGQLLDVNPAYSQQSGYTREELLGMRVFDLKLAESAADTAAVIQRAIQSGGEKFESRHRRKDGSLWDAEVSMTYSPLGEGQFFVFFRDITERKRVGAELVQAKASAEQANHSKSRFLAAASHDLRQPLAALSLFVGVLKRKSPPDCTELVSKIEVCIGSLSEMLTDLLDISKLDAGVVTPTPSDFSVDELLDSFVSLYTGEAELKGLRLRVRRSGAFGRTDPQLLHRILGNLVANAIRYTGQGGVLMACRCHQGKQWIEVWDTGIGIAAEKTSVIFEEFRQLGDESRNRGSGLGLAIVAKAAALLGLQIRLQSRPGRGSCFAIEVPPGRASRPMITATSLAPVRPLRIAMVEDHTLVLQALTLALARDGHDVIAATSGSALLAKLGRQGPDLLISDYRLAQNETGFEVIDAVRSQFGVALPVILMTGDTDPALVRIMADRGVAVLYKPLQMDALQTFIRGAAERR